MSLGKDTTAEISAKRQRMYVRAWRRYGGTGDMAALRGTYGSDIAEHPRKRRSPLLRDGERFAIIPEGWIGKLGGGSNTEVFVALCLHASPEGEAWPSKALISQFCGGLSLSRVQAALRSLQQVGAITLLVPGKAHDPSRYRINKSPRVFKNTHPNNGGK